MSEIPQILIDNIKKKNVVLFLGSGFSYNSKHPNGDSAPLGKQLGTMISNAFLGGKYQDSPLTYISDLAISQSSLFEVQRLIYDIFIKFEPNDDQIKFSDFPWKTIFTTNYDLILEKAFKLNKNTCQELSIVFKNTRE